MLPSHEPDNFVLELITQTSVSGRSELPGDRLLSIPEKIRISDATPDCNSMQFGTTQDLEAFLFIKVSYFE